MAFMFVLKINHMKFRQTTTKMYPLVLTFVYIGIIIVYAAVALCGNKMNRYVSNTEMYTYVCARILKNQRAKGRFRV